ncbi:MAG: ABC transporter ATP-binding protein [Desulfosarcinaceae bacterium]|nr:ABC transporter ATP-binding protein [Desulfosarcinaceae bacterium]
MNDLQMAEETLHERHDLRLLHRLYPFVRPYLRLVLLSIVLVVGITLVELTLPYVTKMAIDRHIVPVEETDRLGPGDADISKAERAAAYAGLPLEERRRLRAHDLAGLGHLALLFLGLVAVNFILNFLQKLVMEYAGHTIMHDLRVRLFDHLAQLSVAFYARNPVARLVTRMTNDVQNMHEFFTSMISLLFKDLFLLVGILVVLFTLHWQLALVSAVVLPLVVGTALGFSGPIRNVFRDQRVKIAEINTRFAETIDGMAVIQSFRAEKRNADLFRSLNHENYRLGMQQIHLFALFMPVIEVIGVITLAALIYFGGGQVIQNQISLGVLVAFITYMRMFFRPIRDLSEKYSILQNALASAERIFLLLDTQEQLPQVTDRASSAETVASQKTATGLQRVQPPAAEDLRRFRSLQFEQVDFAYTPEEKVLNQVSFTLRAGKTLALVGPTGSGKTTLINLIVRFYDPTAGRVRLNGHDLRHLPLEQVRALLALVTQDPFLFSGTVKANLFPHLERVDSAEFERVVAAADCQDLIARLPEGGDTLLAEGGSLLSSGERQLLSVARALARDPQLIILDEATSYIDSETEARLQAAMQRLMTGRSAIIVAHRLSTARQADHILVLNRGVVVEAGSHAALIEKDGFYARLYRLQGLGSEAPAAITA